MTDSSDYIIANGEKIKKLINRFYEQIKDDEDINSWQWGEKFRKLKSNESATTGNYSTKKTPYVKEIMECLSQYSSYERVCFMKASQIGGTELGLIQVFYWITHCKNSVICVYPDKQVAKKVVKTKFDPFIEETEPTRKQLIKRSFITGHNQNNILHKQFIGGNLITIGALNPDAMRALTAKYFFFDEVDAYPAITQEGNSIELILNRGRSFGEDRKAFLNSTPTRKGESNIEALFLESDMRYYHVPCPHCQHKQVLYFQNIVYDEVNNIARMRCIKCKELIDEYHKEEMLNNGEWIATRALPISKKGKEAGFHLSALYDPFRQNVWTELYLEFLDCEGDAGKEEVFITTKLAETYEPPNFTPIPEVLKENLCNSVIFAHQIAPANTVYIVAGCDVQGNRIEFIVMAYTIDNNKYVIDDVVIEGDTMQKATWSKLDKALKKTYKVKDKKYRLPIQLTCIDSGFNDDSVIEFVSTQTTINLNTRIDVRSPKMIKPNTVVMIKGHKARNDNNSAPIIVNKKRDGLYKSTYRHKDAVPKIIISTGTLKRNLYYDLQQTVKHELNKEINDTKCSGLIYFHQNCNLEFFNQVASEKFIKDKWHKIYKDNEALDCICYCYVAAYILGIGDVINVKFLEKRLNNLNGKDVKQKINLAENNLDISVDINNPYDD